MTKSRSVFRFEFGVFDLDGTLIDSMEACGRIFAELVSPSGVDGDEARAFYYDTTGSPMREQFRAILGMNGGNVRDETIESLRREFDARFLAEDFRMFPGAWTLLARLVGRGTTLFLSSACADACVAKRLLAGDFGGFFRLALGSTAVPKGIAHLDRFAASLGTAPAQFGPRAFFVGDGEADMRIAKTCGMHAIGVEGTVSAERLRQAGADRIVPSVKRLLRDSPRPR
jgi:phosphoglycolate phosphatase-like HAD superfamily hydrolase